jgi:hypothetical protein
MAPDLQLERDAATTDDTALVRYHAKWEKALARLQRAHPGRWSVPGWSAEEVRDALTLRLIEVVRGDAAQRAVYEREGKEWALLVMGARLAELRKIHRLHERPMDFDDAPLVPREPNQEERWIDAEMEACRGLARSRVEQSLTRPQRRWFAAMRIAANGGAFFHASDQLNLSAASRVLGKHRSSALRAWSELRAVFERELERLR